MINKFIALLLTFLFVNAFTFAQDHKTVHSVDMRPGTTAPNLPSKNSPPDFAKENRKVEDEIKRGGHVTELQLKKNRWSRPKASPTPLPNIKPRS